MIEFWQRMLSAPLTVYNGAGLCSLTLTLRPHFHLYIPLAYNFHQLTYTEASADNFGEASPCSLTLEKEDFLFELFCTYNSTSRVEGTLLNAPAELYLVS